MALLEEYGNLVSSATPEAALSAFSASIPNRRMGSLDLADISEVIEGTEVRFDAAQACALGVAFGERLLTTPRLPLIPETLMRALPSINAVADALTKSGKGAQADSLVYRAFSHITHMRGSQSELPKRQVRDWLSHAYAGMAEYHGRFALTTSSRQYPAHVRILDTPLAVTQRSGNRLELRFRHESPGGTSFQIREGLPAQVDTYVARAENPRVLFLRYR